MQRLAQAPNLALATLWADMLNQAGFEVTVLGAYAGSIAGEIPPDQALPALWVLDEAQHPAALRFLAALRNLPHRHWLCHGCGESVDGPFEQCWQCGAMRPGP
ncbi:MAG: DUF2007 domain-containing protein [Burkholderiales bacterium]